MFDYSIYWPIVDCKFYPLDYLDLAIGQEGVDISTSFVFSLTLRAIDTFKF